MKNILKITSLLLCLLLTLSVMLTGCGEDKDSTDTNEGNETQDPVTDAATSADYSELNLDKYIKLGSYKELVIDAIGSSEDVELFNAIVSRCEILEYPAGPLSYYIAQSKEKYELYAEKGNMTYEELMKALDIDDEDLEREAKVLVKKDLVTLAIVKAEGLGLTDTEKTDLFDKYAELYVDLYGYTEEYIRENLTEEIYASMQYDKMMEYLIKLNYFIAED